MKGVQVEENCGWCRERREWRVLHLVREQEQNDLRAPNDGERTSRDWPVDLCTSGRAKSRGILAFSTTHSGTCRRRVSKYRHGSDMSSASLVRSVEKFDRVSGCRGRGSRRNRGDDAEESGKKRAGAASCSPPTESRTLPQSQTGIECRASKRWFGARLRPDNIDHHGTLFDHAGHPPQTLINRS